MIIWSNAKKVVSGGLIAGCFLMVGTTTLTGCLTDDKKDSVPVVVEPKHTALATATKIDVGAQGATGGSVIDLDSAKAWGSVVANANQSGIDLVFMYYGSAFHLDNAVAAKAAGLANSINLTNSYGSTIVGVDIVKVTTLPNDQEAAAKAFTDGSKISGSAVVEGDMFLVKSTGGKLVLVTVGAIVGADKTGGAKISLSVNTI